MTLSVGSGSGIITPESGSTTLLKRQRVKITGTLKLKYPSNWSAPVPEPGRPMGDYHMHRIKRKCPRFTSIIWDRWDSLLLFLVGEEKGRTIRWLK
jgi:hypothetical protein